MSLGIRATWALNDKTSSTATFVTLDKLLNFCLSFNKDSYFTWKWRLKLTHRELWGQWRWWTVPCEGSCYCPSGYFKEADCCCSVTKSCPTLWVQGLKHVRLPCPSLSSRVWSNSCPLNWWCYPTISCSVIPFSSCPQSFPASGSFPMSRLFTSSGQSIGASVSASVLPLNIQGWFPLGLTGLLSLLSSSVQFSSFTQSCSTLCNPMNCSTPGLPVHHQLPEFTQTHVHWVSDAIQSSHPLFSPSPSTFKASGSFPVSQVFISGGQNTGVSVLTSVLPMNTQDRLPLGWTGWISLQSKGLSRVFSNTTIHKHQFFCVQPSL